MVHISNYGSFGQSLHRFADLNGFVPEAGDKLEDFTYPGGYFDCEESPPEAFDDFLTKAVLAMDDVEEALEMWRVQG